MTNFDRVARPYRWLEYLSFGPWLARCRRGQLAHLAQARHALVHALVLGDGDGRFLERLLAVNLTLTADVLDSSASMLRLLEQRTHRARRRLRLHHRDALSWTPAGSYNLIVSHFFLDCFFPAELEQLLDRVLPHARPGAQWVISEFAIPHNPFAAYLADRLIRLLYRAFGWLTGLRVRRLPDYDAALLRRGLVLQHDRRYLGGLLCSQIWLLPNTPARK